MAEKFLSIGFVLLAAYLALQTIFGGHFSPVSFFRDLIEENEAAQYAVALVIGYVVIKSIQYFHRR